MSSELSDLSDSPCPPCEPDPECDIFRHIAAATAAVTGEAFFRTLVEKLATVLGTRYADSSEKLPGGERARTLAYRDADGLQENFEYPLAGSPCAAVARGERAHHPEGLQEAFPDDEILRDLGAVSYAGVPILGPENEVRGHLAVLDTEPLPESDRVLALFEIFAARASVELLRDRTARDLERSERRLASVLASAMDAIIGCDADLGIVLFDGAAETLFGWSADEAIGRSLSELCEPRLDRAVRGFISADETDQTRQSYLWAPGGLQARRADGATFPVEATIARTTDNDGPSFVVILRDVSARLEKEAQVERLSKEVRRLRDELELGGGINLIGRGAAMASVREQIEQVAETDATVLLTGETGTGKELVCRAIHASSLRKDGPLVKLNCAALPTGLVESELFGHEKGAFTGATSRKAGRFELANGGTIFLDEIGEMPLDVQVKLLRVLQEREVERIGGATPIPVDVRVIAATHRDLEADVAAGRFREDLYYRLAVFPVRVPPLRERRDDIPELVEHLVETRAERLGKARPAVTDDVLEALASYDWPGNVRELGNVVERSIILTRGETLTLPPEFATTRRKPASPGSAGDASLADVERRHILDVLSSRNGVVDGPSGAARVLDLHPNTLRSRMKKLGIRKEEYARSGGTPDAAV